MATPYVAGKNKRRRFGALKSIFLSALALLILLVLITTISSVSQTNNASSLLSSSSYSSVNNQRYGVDDKCKELPMIHPSGSFFLDSKVDNVSSLDGINPPFQIGSRYAQAVQHHMNGDKGHFTLIQELIQRVAKSAPKSKTLSFDMGANQGFFTYYLAALGLDVHSFEISHDNFKTLQHGQHFNTKDVSDRVHVYPVGLSNKVSRFSIRGGHYEGFLKESDAGDAAGPGGEGEILGVTFDCFAYHHQHTFDLTNTAFVKLDVEGFEIAVLMGAKNSLFHKRNNIGGMLMEVGPSRWNRASISLETGIREMIHLASIFENSYLLLRDEGKRGTCPITISEGVLADTSPQVVNEKTRKYKVAPNEWSALLIKMGENNFDCNFWYTNY